MTSGSPRGDGSDGVGIRLLEPADWQILRQVRLAALADAPTAFASTLASERAREEAEWRQWAATTACFVAETPAQPCGIVATGPQAAGDATTDYAGTQWGLWSMWVSPGRRGSGVADRLVSAAVSHAAAGGGARIILWVADGNERARGFYLRMGFQPTGTRQVYRRDDGSELGEEALALDLPADR